MPQPLGLPPPRSSCACACGWRGKEPRGCQERAGVPTPRETPSPPRSASCRGPLQFRHCPPGGAPRPGRVSLLLPALPSLAAGYRLPSAAGGSHKSCRGCCERKSKEHLGRWRSIPAPTHAGVRSRLGKGRAGRGVPSRTSATPHRHVPSVPGVLHAPLLPRVPYSEVSASPSPAHGAASPHSASSPCTVPPLSRPRPARFLRLPTGLIPRALLRQLLQSPPPSPPLS